MRRWMRKMRGILGLTTVGAVGGAVFGALWSLGAAAVGGFYFGGPGWTVALFSGFGAFSSGGMALLLAGRDEGTDIEDLSPWRVAAYGALAGALAPVGLVLAVTGGLWTPGLGIVVGISSALGGLLGGGVMAAARRARRGELEGGGAIDVLGPGG